MNPNPLTLEQEYQIALFAHQVQGMDEPTVKDALNRYYETMVRREAYYKRLIAQQWGLEPKDTGFEDSLNEWG